MSFLDLERSLFNVSYNKIYRDYSCNKIYRDYSYNKYIKIMTIAR